MKNPFLEFLWKNGMTVPMLPLINAVPELARGHAAPRQMSIGGFTPCPDCGGVPKDGHFLSFKERVKKAVRFIPKSE